MRFRLKFDLPFLAIWPREPVEFSVPSDRGPALIHFQPVDPEKEGDYRWECFASCSCEPKQKIKEVFDRLVDGTLNPNVDWKQFGMKELEFLGPPDFRAFVDDVQSILSDLARRTVSLIQWRLDLPGSHQPLNGGGRLWWNTAEDDWRPIPGIGGMVAGCAFSPRRIREKTHGDLLAMLNAGRAEPLGHELLREAKELCRSGGFRSAFVVAISAAEVGVKQCIVELLPQTDWLMENLQSPPLSKLIEDFLPTIPPRQQGDFAAFPLPESLRKTFKNAVHIRNTLIHTGSHPKARTRLGIVLAAVQELLYRIDYHCGNHWAVDSLHWDRRFKNEFAGNES